MDEVENRIQTAERLRGVEVTMSAVEKRLDDLANNHLLHINDQITNLTRTVVDNNTALTALINTKITDIYKQLSKLSISDARQEPNNRIITKVVDYVILALIAAAVSLLLRSQ